MHDDSITRPQGHAEASSEETTFATAPSEPTGDAPEERDAQGETPDAPEAVDASTAPSDPPSMPSEEIASGDSAASADSGAPADATSDSSDASQEQPAVRVSVTTYVAEATPSEQSSAPGETADASASVDATSGPEPSDQSSERPEPRIKIGSQRESEKPARPVASQGPPKNPPKPSPSEPVPVPSLRKPLEDDVEADVLAALGEANEQVLQAAASAAPRELEAGAKVQGAVASVLKDTVLFDLGGGAQGAVASAKFQEPPTIGSVHEVVVQGRTGDEGLYDLSLPGASVDVADWSQLQEGMVVEARITGANTGGLEGNVGGIRAFVPASQVALYRVDNLSEFINQRLDCVVLEAKKSKRNLVLSRRAVLEREREKERQEKLQQIKPGDVVEGVVRSMREFGAFVDIGGVEGLVHVRQLSWERIKHPKEVLEDGQRIKVKIEKVNQQTGKISLLFRDLSENPWSRVEEKYAVNAQVRGTVSKIAEFGAFVKLEPGVEGLIHISELAHARVHRVSDVVKEGQDVEVKVLSVDVKEQRIGLSLKALLAPPEPVKKAEPEPEPEPERPARKKRSAPLKGGIGGASGGDQFGLRW